MYIASKTNHMEDNTLTNRCDIDPIPKQLHGQEKKKDVVVIGIDPGNRITGIAILVNDQIVLAENADNAKVMSIILSYKRVGVKLRVMIEVISPYTGYLRQTLIDTCYWIGELEYRLKTSRIAYKTITRTKVRRWVFNEYPEIVQPLVKKRLQKKAEKENKPKRMPSFHYVNDSIIVSTMREVWNVDAPKAGKSNQYGLSEHSWQALAIATGYEVLRVN